MPKTSCTSCSYLGFIAFVYQHPVCTNIKSAIQLKTLQWRLLRKDSSSRKLSPQVEYFREGANSTLILQFKSELSTEVIASSKRSFKPERYGDSYLLLLQARKRKLDPTNPAKIHQRQCLRHIRTAVLPLDPSNTNPNSNPHGNLNRLDGNFTTSCAAKKLRNSR